MLVFAHKSMTIQKLCNHRANGFWGSTTHGDTFGCVKVHLYQLWSMRISDQDHSGAEYSHVGNG